MSKILNWFKRKKPEEITFHPKLEKPIKYAFSIGNEAYYQFVNEYEIPKKRFVFAQQFSNEMQNKISKESLIEFCKAIKTNCDNGKLGDAYKLADELEYRTTWLFEPETLLRFASVIFFTLKENITEYDMTIGAQKIELFKKKDLLTVLLKKLMSRSDKLLSLSEDDLNIYLMSLNEKMQQQLDLVRKSKDLKDS